VIPSKRACSGERAWKAIGDRLRSPNYLSRVVYERKISYRRQRTDIGKYSFVNRTIRLWNRLSAELLGTLPCKPNGFRKRVRRVINVAKLRNSTSITFHWVKGYAGLRGNERSDYLAKTAASYITTIAYVEIPINRGNKFRKTTT